MLEHEDKYCAYFAGPILNPCHSQLMSVLHNPTMTVPVTITYVKSRSILTKDLETAQGLQCDIKFNSNNDLFSQRGSKAKFPLILFGSSSTKGGD